MKKTILALMIGAGFSTAAFAGSPPGPIDCNNEYEVCVNGFTWEIDYKCEDGWTDDGSYVYAGDTAHLEAVNGYADCRADIDLESDDDVYKYEYKCQIPNDTKKGGPKAELEIKATLTNCTPG